MDTNIPHSLKKQNAIHAYFKRIHTLRASDAFLLQCGLVAVIVCASLLIVQTSMNYRSNVATYGGTYREGIVGTPRFINPVLAVTRADKDLTALVYDGLMKLGADGTLTPSIAESLTISEDGLTYNIVLRRDVYFHDGMPVTARDILFTFNRIQDPLLASPLRGNFDGVHIEEVGEFEINFVLPEAYAPFIENLTFGILPEHIWRDAGSEEFPFSQYNNEPIGAGPYSVEDIVLNASGIPESYLLTAYEHYHLGQPKIASVALHFFTTEESLYGAFQNGLIDGVAGIDASRIHTYEQNNVSHTIIRIPLPRTFGVFLNQNKSPALRDLSARRALSAVIDRTVLIETVLNGYGRPLTTPIPPGFGFDSEKMLATTSLTIEEARDILKAGGWKLNQETQQWEKDIDKVKTPLTISIATVNSGAFEATANFLRETWESLGVPVTIKQFEQTDLTQAIIRPREYEALLFGTHVGRPLDFYSFWHSSQRNDPGLNIALYANITTDSILSEMRRALSAEMRAQAFEKFIIEIEKETPAFFLYAPELIYLFPHHVEYATFEGVGEPHERFAQIHNWYTETDAIWPLFIQKN